MLFDALDVEALLSALASARGDRSVAERRWVVRYKSRIITGGWEESLFYQEDNARGFARDAGDGTTVKEYLAAASLSDEVEGLKEKNPG